MDDGNGGGGGPSPTARGEATITFQAVFESPAGEEYALKTLPGFFSDCANGLGNAIAAEVTSEVTEQGKKFPYLISFVVKSVDIPKEGLSLFYQPTT